MLWLKKRVPGFLVSLLSCCLFAQSHAALRALNHEKVSALTFSPCADSQDFPELRHSLCARYQVPNTYELANTRLVNALAEQREISLFIRQFPALASNPSQGRIWLIAGGPGDSGASLYPMIDVMRRAFPGFDLMIPDSRGTGYSSRLCPAEERVQSAGGAALVDDEWRSCFVRLNQHPELAQIFSLTNAAHDLKALLEHSTSSQPTYLYGVSYGTQLILRTLQLGKLPLQGVLLDSLVPPQTASSWDLSHRSFVVDEVGRAVFANCDNDVACRQVLQEKTEILYERLLMSLPQNPALLNQIPGNNVKRFFGSLLDLPAARARIPYLIKDLLTGHQDELQAVLQIVNEATSGFGRYPQSPVSIPLVSIISASENNLRPSLSAEALRYEEQDLLFTSVLPSLLVNNGLPIYQHDEYFGHLPQVVPPMMILQGTLDPKTSYAGALAQVAQLRHGVRAERQTSLQFVPIHDAPHFILWSAPDEFVRNAQHFLQELAR